MAQEQIQSTEGVANGQITPEFEKIIRRAVKAAIGKALPSALEETTRRWGHDAEVAGLIHLLAARSNDAKDEVVLKALTLYGLALDAREKGNRLAIIDAEDFLVHDVLGFEPVEASLGRSEK